MFLTPDTDIINDFINRIFVIIVKLVIITEKKTELISEKILKLRPSHALVNRIRINNVPDKNGQRGCSKSKNKSLKHFKKIQKLVEKAKKSYQ